MNQTEQFRNAIRADGLIPPDVIEPGKLHRFPGIGKSNGNTAAWCKLFPDGIGGVYGDYSTGLSSGWQANRDRPYSQAEREAFMRDVAEAKAQAEKEQAERHAKAATQAAAIWDNADDAPPDHPYLVRKGIQPHNLRVHEGKLLVPMKDATGKLWNVERIAPEKPANGTDKKGLYGGRRTGLYCAIGSPEELKTHNAICIAEGFADAASIREATGYPVVDAFDVGNLGSVALALRQKYPDTTLVFCADDDYRTEGNPGLTKATDAARSVGGLVVVPDFGANRPDGAKDFNDLTRLRGPDAVKAAIDVAMKVGADDTATDEPPPATDPDGWPDPLPLTAKVPPEPYPLDALPDTIRAAVIEVQAFTKAPIPMVAGAALAALSLAIQSYVDVRRADKLQSPVGLFLLTIADSGERKSTCDSYFTSAIRDYQAEQAELAKPEQEKFRAKLSAWEAKRAGILDAIKQASKASKSTANIERDLHLHEQDKPKPPMVPKLLRGDDTPENLAYVLAREWPSAGAICAEGGTYFGSHGMGAESAMRNMGLINVLWDGGTLDIGRRSKESFTVRGARLTVALQVQEPTLREFLAKSGALARGTGFLARFLVALPESTQGFRPFTEAPANWPHLAEFNRRIAAILKQPAPIDDSGALTPAMMTLAPKAKAAWINYHDAIESELASGGELYDVRDVASKSADNAARLSALFQVFEHGTGTAVGLDCFEGASRIAAWHLHESRRFFGELALPAELADAARLDTWLIEYCKRKSTLSVAKNYVRQHGPLRDGKRLDAAIRELAAFERLKLNAIGKHLTISLNPALVA